jgi:hypothetical protein
MFLHIKHLHDNVVIVKNYLFILNKLSFEKELCVKFYVTIALIKI